MHTLTTMMTRTLAFAAFGLATLAASAQPQGVTPYSLPYAVGDVNPPQGLISLLGEYTTTNADACPLGAQDISLTFVENYPIEVNTEAEGEVAIYVNGSETPAETLPANSVAIDAMGAPKGGFRFKNDYTGNATYHITIPAGCWRFNKGSEDSPSYIYSPAVELAYECYTSYVVTPSVGAVSELGPDSPIIIDFPDFDHISKASNSFTLNSTTGEFAVSGKVAEGPDGRRNRFVFDSFGDDGTLKIPGTYYLSVAPKAFNLFDAEGNQWKSEKIYSPIGLFPYGKPVSSPAEGYIDSFTTLTLTFEGDFTPLMINDRATSTLYRVDANGKISKDRVALARVNGAGATSTVSFYDTDWNALDEFIPEPGKYALVIAAGTFSGLVNGALISAPDFAYYFNVGQEEPVELPLPVVTDASGTMATDGIDNCLELHLNFANGWRVEDVAADMPMVMTLGDELVYSLAAFVVDSDSYVALKAVDADGLPLEEAPLTQGETYEVTVPAGLYTLVNADNVRGANEAFSFEVLGGHTSGVAPALLIAGPAEAPAIYTIGGIRLAPGASLPAGVYVIDGKKVAVRR